MPDTVLIDELFLTVRVPADMAEADRDAARLALTDPWLMDRLTRAVRGVFDAHPALATLGVSLTR